MKSSLEIAQEAELRPIQEIAAAAGLEDAEVEPYGRYKAKIRLSVLDRLKDKPDGKIICVTAITPTKAGEGKTTTSVSLTQGMGAIGEQALLCIREASLGPVFGIKGGAAGAGYAQVVPMEDLNLHFTGDMHAISAANNLLAAFLDAHVMHGNELDIDPHSISWRRCVDMNDRGLRQIITGLGGATNGSPRETGFDITAASEVMAILALARDLEDLRHRLGSITVAYNRAGDAVTAEQIGCAGSMAVLLKDAIMPNLVQTLEGQPAFVHCGPFANIAHGNSSLIADRIALKMADYVITESGFGADMGMQKFMDIVCRQGGIRPSAVVVVATVKALRVHGGSPDGSASSPEESMTQLRAGIANLAAHIRTVQGYGIPCVVAVNRFPNDTDEEVELVRTLSLEAGAMDAQHNTAVVDGGKGAADLARAVVKAANTPSDFKLTYPDEASIEDKIAAIATKVYGADGVEFLPEARGKLKRFAELGYGNLPICMAKTHLSISHDPLVQGAPTGFTVPIRDLRVYTGAGFVTALCGTIVQMPGLGKTPGRPQHRHRRRGAHGRALLVRARAGFRQLSTSASLARGTQSARYLINHPSVDRGQRIDLSRLLELARWLDPQISTDAEHSTRVSRVAIELADAAGLDGRGVAQTTLAGLLHDVGKIIVPRAVLLKPGRLEPGEYDTVKRHPSASAQLAERAALTGIATILRHHHERWDGAGYPHGLAGERIPLVSRVLAIADAYDAMLADRPYRNAMTVQQASKELEAGAGTQFDPVLVEAFLRRGIGHSAQLRSQHTGSPLSLAA